MIDPRTRHGRLRRRATVALAVAYLLAFVPLVTQGVMEYLTLWLAVQMVLGVAAAWLYPPGRRPRRASTSASPRSDVMLVRAPRG